MVEETIDIDEKDIQILMAIGELKTSNSKKIVEKTGIPNSTVHYRLQQLQQQGILKNDLFEIDLEKVGLPVTVISEVQAEFGEGYHKSIGEKLSAIEGVNQVYFVMGDTDFVVISNLHNRSMVKQLVDEFESMDGIIRTSSKFVIEPVKYPEFPLGNYQYETLLELI